MRMILSIAVLFKEDIQSWWEVPSIAHFCSLFRTAFNLLDFDIEDLEDSLLTDGTEESSWLQELIVRLLSGCLPNNEISTFNYQMFLRRLFRQKCQEHDRYNPFNTDIDFQLLPLRTKVDILHALCDFRLDADDVLDQLKNLEADSLRVEPLGYDSNESAYWYFYGTRLYREDYTTKNNKKKAVWQVICFTEDDWFQLTKKLKKSTNKAERQLHHTLSENFLPELPRLFKEKENLARKRLLENLPRRTSNRLKKLETEIEKEVCEKDALKEEQHQREQRHQEEETKKKKIELENRRQEAYERRNKLKEEKSEDENIEEYSSDEMTSTRSKRAKTREKSWSAEEVTSTKSSKSSRKRERQSDNESKILASKPTTVGRQTNNSLSAATGQILIQPVGHTNKKKLKTSQVFRQTDEDLQTGMHKILDFVKNHEDAWPFTDPVEEEYAPNYYSIIRKPMDLQRMEERLDSGYYKNFDKFRGDFQLIVDNCKLYNGAENEYTEMVDNLLQVFEKGTEKYLDQISSSDDEIAIEFSNEDKVKQKNKKSEEVGNEKSSQSRRKPMLVAQTDRKRVRSESEDSMLSLRSRSYESPYRELNTRSSKHRKIEHVESPPEKTSKAGKSKKGKDDLKLKKEREDSKSKKEKEDSKSKKEKDSSKVKKEKDDSKSKKEKEDSRLKKEKDESRLRKEKEESKLRREKEESKLRKEKEDSKWKKEKEDSKVKKDKDESKMKKEREDSKKDKDDTKGKKETEDSKMKKDKEESKIKKEKEESKSKKEKEDSKKVKVHEKKSKAEIKEKETRKEKSKKTLKTKSKKANKKEKRKKGRPKNVSRSPSFSPPPSDSPPPSSPDSRFEYLPKSASKKMYQDELSDIENSIQEDKRNSGFSEFFEDFEDLDHHFDKKIKRDDSLSLSPKPKDKHNKLRETIEKLKAKSEIKLKNEFEFEIDHPKENKDKSKKIEKEDKYKSKIKEKSQKAFNKDIKLMELDDPHNTMDSIQSEGLKTKRSMSSTSPNIFNKPPASNMDALSIATEQTLKDINKWLDDTPKFAEFSSASNSPSYGLDDLDTITSKLDQIPGKKIEKPLTVKKEGNNKDPKKKPFRDPSKFFKRREVQRTIDRLQPGKGKGNLISNVQNTSKADEIFPLGPLSKLKDTKNSLIVKTNTNAPKLSLGSVLDSFGKHKFVDDQKKDEDKQLEEVQLEEKPVVQDTKTTDVENASINKKTEEEVEKKPQEPPSTEDANSGGATPNLSAWFKAFGAPKIQPVVKKSETKSEVDKEKSEEIKSLKVPLPLASPNTDSHGQPVRQRRISTGSSMSERSSFSQDMDSPRVGMDERGAYPAPYPSPLHRSPSGASPIMASPRPDISPKAAYSTINGQIRVGFYQDTVSNKSSPDKSCSPRENSQSPYPHYSEHVYTPNTTAESAYYAYTNPPYYTHVPNYSSTNPTPPYNAEGNYSFYDTNKAQTPHNYTANSPASNHSSPHQQHSANVSPNMNADRSPGMNPPSVHSQHSPNMHPQHSPIMHSQHSPTVYSAHSPTVLPQHSPNIIPQNSPGIHPQNSPGIHPQHSPGIHPQHSPGIHPQHSPGIHPQHSPGIHPQHSPGIHPQHSPGIHAQHSPGIHAQHSPVIHPQHSPGVHPQHSPGVPVPGVLHSQHSPLVQRPPSALSAGLCSNSPELEGFAVQEEQNKVGDKSQGAVFPVKKRAYNDNELPQISNQKFEIDKRLTQQIEMKKNLETQQTSKEKAEAKAYVHQNIPDPKSLSMQSSEDFFGKVSAPTPQQLAQAQSNFNYNAESNYSLNVPGRDRTMTPTQQSKIDMSKYTNMGYTGPDVNTRSLQQLNFPATTMSQKEVTSAQASSTTTSAASSDLSMRYGNPNLALQQMGYKGVEGTTTQQTRTNFESSVQPNARTDTINDRLSQIQNVSSASMSRSNYNAASVDVGRTMANLSHIVDRFSNEDRMMVGLQNTSSFYGDKGLGSSHILNKPISSSASALPIFSQANMAAIQSYNQNLQVTSASLYNRQMADLQNTGVMQSDLKSNQQMQAQEKKSKKRKSSKNVPPTSSSEPQQQTASNQGFQSYAGLKGNASLEPSAISLKTSSVVPGSAFNFGPTPAGLGISSGLYADKDAYPNFLEEFRSAPNYYMAAAAAAHHRSTPDNAEKQTRPAHQNSNPQTYPFLGGPPQSRSTYPIAGPFLPNAQAQLMDTSSPLYQHYLQAGVLNQGLLPPPGAYPPGYHPALSMRQPYDSMNRPPWL